MEGSIKFLIIALLIPIIYGELFTKNEEDAVMIFVDNVMNCRHIPGMNLAIVKGNKTWTRGFGFADRKSQREATNDTVFAIGSLGKAFTMTLLGIFIQNTNYTWNTKLNEIKGLNLQFIDEKVTREATIADLLAHRTGLSSVNDYGFIAGYPEGTDRKFLSKRTKYIPKSTEFRESFIYNNMMYMLIGYITELLGNESWEHLITSRVLEPLGMTSSKVLLSSTDVLEDNVAKPYIMPGDQLKDGHYDIYKMTPLEPAGAIMSSANDMAQWMRFNLRNGTTDNGHQLIANHLLQEAFQEHNSFRYDGAFVSQAKPKYPIDDLTKAYGYGWFISSYRDFRRIWHSGGLFSYISLIWLYPDEQIGVFANVNGPGTVAAPGYALRTILSYASDILLGQTPWLDFETACSYPSPWVNNTKYSGPETINYTNDRIGDFIGTYGNVLLPDITLSVKERGQDDRYLWLEMNRIKGELLPTAKMNDFQFRMTEPWEYAIERVLGENIVLMYQVNFTRSNNGFVEAFTMSLSGKDIMLYRKNLRFMDTDDVSSSTSKRGSFLFVVLFLISASVLN